MNITWKRQKHTGKIRNRDWQNAPSYCCPHGDKRERVSINLTLHFNRSGSNGEPEPVKWSLGRIFECCLREPELVRCWWEDMDKYFALMTNPATLDDDKVAR